MATGMKSRLVGKMVQPLQSVKLLLTIVVTVKSDLDPHMISGIGIGLVWLWWFGADLGEINGVVQ